MICKFFTPSRDVMVGRREQRSHTQTMPRELLWFFLEAGSHIVNASQCEKSAMILKRGTRLGIFTKKLPFWGTY